MLRVSILAIFCIVSVLSAPPVTETDSLVVTSTTKTPTTDSVKDGKEGDEPKVPKIYEMKVDTNVSNRFTTTLITSKVRNLAKNAQEATFSVVLPESAYISGFVMEIAGKSYEAYVKEKEEAKQIYNQAVESGQAAAHVAVNARDSNRFTVSVNLEPQSKATFKLTYEDLLQRKNDQYEIVLNIHPGQPVKDMNVRVNINETRPLKFVKTPALRSGNEISKNDDKLDPLAKIDTINSTSAVVQFTPDVERQKQLAQGLGTKEENGLAGQFVVQYDVERDPQGGEVLVKDGYFVHFFAPSDVAALPKYVVFVLDTSGSMDGIRLKQLKEAMNSILVELKTDDLLSIVEFGSTVKVWNIDNVTIQYEVGSDPWMYQYETTETPPKQNKTEQVLPKAFAASEDIVKKAKEVVNKLDAYGGTDIKSGLETGLKLVKKTKDETKSNHQPIIIFLTDGEPTVGEVNTEKITSGIKEINIKNLDCPIFSLSFGDGADRDFLQRISLQNLGFARHIYEAADASLQLEEFYRQISSPLLTNVTFKYVSNVTKLTKTYFPIFFRGSELIVAGELGRIDPDFVPASVGCYGIRGPIELVPKVEQPIGSLERMWAYLTVQQILEARDAADNKTQFTKKALDIALKYSFVTPVSSLVVVKPNDTKADVATEDASKRQNYHIPANAFYGLPGPPGAPVAAAGGQYSLLSLNRPIIPLSGYAGLSTPISRYPAPAPSATYSSSLINRFESESFDTSMPDIRVEEIPESQTDSIDNHQFDSLKQSLPWLSSILSENGTLTDPPGDYKLGLNETITDKPDCPKTPNNGTAGFCSLLHKCPTVFSLLTDVSVFKQYFCPLNGFAGICCPN